MCVYGVRLTDKSDRTLTHNNSKNILNRYVQVVSGRRYKMILNVVCVVSCKSGPLYVVLKVYSLVRTFATSLSSIDGCPVSVLELVRVS